MRRQYFGMIIAAALFLLLLCGCEARRTDSPDGSSQSGQSGSSLSQDSGSSGGSGSSQSSGSGMESGQPSGDSGGGSGSGQPSGDSGSGVESSQPSDGAADGASEEAGLDAPEYGPDEEDGAQEVPDGDAEDSGDAGEVQAASDEWSGTFVTESETLTVEKAGDTALTFSFAQAGISGTAELNGLQAVYHGDDHYVVVFNLSGTVIDVSVSSEEDYDASGSPLIGSYIREAQ